MVPAAAAGTTAVPSQTKGNHMRKLIPLVALVLAGCGGVNPAKNPDPVEVSGTVQLAGGKPVPDGTLHLQPTGSGGQATLPVKNGRFKGSVMPGKYTWYLASAARIPDKYKEGSLDRQIDVAPGAALALTAD